MGVFGEGRNERLVVIRSPWVVATALLVAACGGGGGGVNSPGSGPPPTSGPMPAPTPAPSPAPSPLPTPSARSAEYLASGAVTAANAGYAYDRSATGKGVTIAVVDTGIDVDGAEFAGRISPDSTGFDQQIARCATCAPETVRFGVDDVIGHGTEVASVAAAARNDAGVHGVAYDATILALKISAPDLSNVTAGSTTPIPESENANIALITPAIRHAVTKGAFVVSMSVNGTSGGQVAADQRAAMEVVRQNDRLVVESVSNFTGEDSFNGQIAQALVGLDMANKDWFLFAIGVDVNGVPRTANGSPGPLADRMLAVAGNGVQVVDKDGGLSTVTGNSFAAPAVAGAAALLKQYWPQLGGKAISRILLDTARDAGAPGVDPVFGTGILDIERAIQPQASTQAFDAASAVLGRYSSLALSAPFGGAGGATRLAGKVARMTVFDRYGRDYRMTGKSGVRAQASGLLASAMLAPVDPPWLAAAATDARFGIASTAVGPWQGARSTRPAMITFSPAPGQSTTLGTNLAVASGGGIAGSPLRAIVAAAIGTSASWTTHGWSASFSTGVARDGRTALRTTAIATPLGIGVELTDLVERGQALGLRAGTVFDIRGARTTLASLIARREVAGVLLSARATAGTTRIEGGSYLLRFSGPLTSSAFAVEGARGLFGGVATLGLSSPLRVEHARAMMLAPIAYDLVSGALSTETTSVRLAPTAREFDLEFGWSAALPPASSLRLGIARAFDAGHVAGATDTAGFVTLVLR